VKSQYEEVVWVKEKGVSTAKPYRDSGRGSWWWSREKDNEFERI
jgi:hypothetical protein